ncbi:MAG: Ig-like domain-containing protein, partial [Gemmatimonadetes bacterium]|nr:Ig-like domain-containing protein [Gemmatimonadota bacterium]
MILRIFPILVSAGILLLLAGCGDILGPRDRGPHGLWIGETGVVLKPGETLTLTARVQETGNTGRQPGSGIEPAANARWWTDDETVLRVPSQSRGRIEALAAGRATVWVQVGARRDSASVTVLAEGEAPTHRWKAVSTSRTGT